MCRDTIQLEDAISTISDEYLLEFTSEYGILEDLHPELLGPEDTIMDFSEGKVEMDLFNLISAPNPAKVKTGTRPRAAHEMSLLTTMANCVIDMEDTTGASGSSGTPSTVEKSPLDFADEDLPPPNTEGVRTEEQIQDEVSHGVPSLENPPTTEVVLEPDLEQEAAAIGPLSTIGGKSLATMGKEAAQDTHAGASSVKDPNPFVSPKSVVMLTTHMSLVSLMHVFQEDGSRERPGLGEDVVYHIAPPGVFLELRQLPNDEFLNQYNINLARQVAMGSKLRLKFEKEAKLLKKSIAQVARRDQRIKAKEKQIKNLEALLEAEADMKKVVEAKNAELVKELECLRSQFSDLQLSNQQLSQQVSTLQAQITSEEKIKAAFEEFKKYEDDKVEQRCAEMDARLDKLSVDFDEELYPHMLTAIGGRRWVIGHDLRLAVMKCSETPELRQAFANVVSPGLVRGMRKGLEHGIEHGKAGRDLEVVEAYDPEAHSKDPWAIKEEMLLEYAIAANVSSAEKKKKCRVVCRTHGVGFAYHVRSNGVLISAPTVAPQGLAILLADASTQTEISAGEASPRLLRSMSLPAMYNLDWP
ncbi:hypothetical protein Tco_0953752 [Tanacetum coccineum]|uniref:Transposase (Putative), gypsy type n=1 Tax=Tanacetum coccineum TaxID=301880 RepID=A0ABQ5E1G9_9ASTR